MTALQALQAARQQGCFVVADGAELVIRAPKGALDTQLRNALVQHKPALLHLLRTSAVTDTPHLRLARHLGKKVGTPRGLAVLHQVFESRTAFALDCDPERLVYLHPVWLLDFLRDAAEESNPIGACLKCGSPSQDRYGCKCDACADSEWRALAGRPMP